MKYSVVLLTLLSVASFAADATIQKMQPEQTIAAPTETTIHVVCPHHTANKKKEPAVVQPSMPQTNAAVLAQDKPLLISVLGQGVAPMNTTSPAQAYALAKRAAVADAYRLIAEKVKGVRVDGQDLIKNMMVKRSTVRTSVDAMVRNANVVETTFKEGLCEVEMEITLSHSQFAQ
ncbi:LPP20 family lipoprotein [Sulfurimonas autotrophica]|uniref:Lipoprotein LPP20-like domain-containing protein n=1 Tax=Sulfurimonas autotrophica (strain ATCC BAA-671 / DSM 16294 / JCM 11897 / OK10) TaxID=563040 RepID=E0UQ41_SULAO|nr:LPP20 family lipoprotein [Sulfurimonas autotrophica]ADN08716.1 protein of unknown function DUF400 [Sulfurimonas autotrophica DSM 16294]